jgi:hypothetical protein
MRVVLGHAGEYTAGMRCTLLSALTGYLFLPGQTPPRRLALDGAPAEDGVPYPPQRVLYAEGEWR